MERHDFDSVRDPQRAERDAPAFEAAEASGSSRPGLARGSWEGAKSGVRIGSYIGVPIAILCLAIGFVITAFGIGAGGGVATHTIELFGLSIFAFCALCGLFVGGFAGALFAIFGLTGSKSPSEAVQNAASPPIEMVRPRERASIAARVFRWARVWGVRIVGVALILAFGTGFYWSWTVQRRLAKAMAAAERDEPSWTLDALMAARKPIPNAENSALVVSEALALLPENWPVAPGTKPGFPKPPRTDAEKAIERINKAPDDVRLDEMTAEMGRRELHEHADAVAIARTLADSGEGRHELEIGRTVIDTLLPETQASRNAARLLSLDAAIRAHDGDFDGALDSTRAVLGVARSIGDEPFAISQLVRIAIGTVAMKSARRVLGQGEPSDEALARLQAAILDELAQPLVVYAMKGERATTAELLRRLAAGEISFSELSDEGPGRKHDARRGQIAPWSKPWLDNQRAIAIEWLNDAVAIARRPMNEQQPLWREWDARIRRTKNARFGIYTAMLPLLLMPALESAATAHARYHGELATTAVMLAAERQRRKTGRWPESVTAIDPSILKEPPVDPYTGQPLHLEYRDGQLFVYTVGSNLKDEHGAYDPRRFRDRVRDDVGTSAWDPRLRRQPPQPDPTQAN